MADIIKRYCETRKDVIQLLIEYPLGQFYVSEKPSILHSFEPSLKTPFITTDTNSTMESTILTISDDEIGVNWIGRI